MKRIFFILLFFVINTVSAQETFEWKAGICQMTGVIDTSKANEIELNNALYIICQPSGLTRPFLWNKPTDSSFVNLETVKREYLLKKAELTSCALPRGIYWEQMRQARLKELKDSYELRSLAIRAYTNPKVLKQQKTPGCSNTEKALILGGDALLAYWKKQHEQELVGALDPASIQQDFNQKWESKDKLLWARIEVTRYGWWNCISEKQLEEISESEIENAFNRLFLEVRENCY
jgi:hypothetical protein